jgi:hypothetical protein
VFLNGGDPRAPSNPFTFIWGDGSTTIGFFPQTKTYAACDLNYTVEVRPNYGSGPVPGSSVEVRFVAVGSALSPATKTTDDNN